MDHEALVRKRRAAGRLIAGALAISGLLLATPALAADSLNGQVLGGGAPIANSTVTLWAASAGAPKQLAQAKSGADGRFAMTVPNAGGADSSLYLVAQRGQPAANTASGDNPRIALMTVLGSKPPAKVTINEMTTVASVWTHAQFLDDTAIRGHALGLRIAAGNVHNFVDLRTGGWGEAIQGPLNSTQSPTMANFATLADLISACVTRVTADACDKLLEAAAPPKGSTPTDTLMAAQSIARYPGYYPERLFALLDAFYPVPAGLGNVWITNKLGNSERGRLKMIEMALAGKVNYDGEPDAVSRLTRVMVEAMYGQTPGWEGGSLTVLHPDGTEAEFSPIYGKGITGPWAVERQRRGC